ncbi:glycosyltransferase [Kocuria sp.]|uniref:glycosyltransferase n=1 Tax=Kocuria sp. TaxID=1871328 RepID=UPI00289D72A1|nr:glycosyltransferase [Kocuria sp.]
MIGYYIHHQGLGHRTRALGIARELGVPVTGFSSLGAPEGWPGEWCTLPMDVPGSPVDPTANGVLHWAPLDHAGYRERMRLLAERLGSDISVMVTDTSAEVTLLARLLGVRTVVMAMRGNRTDRTHRDAYDAASLIVAPWTAETAEEYWPREWTDKTVFTGATSRFDQLAAAYAGPAADVTGPSSRRKVLVVWGGGGTEVTEQDIDRARLVSPDWEWTVRTPAHPSPDLWADLQDADVVVTHGGNNAVAELSAAARPAVVIAQPRPFDEQHATVRALRNADVCTALDGWPEAAQWPTLLGNALARGSSGWSRWRHGDGARRAAQAIERLDDVVVTCGSH